MIIQLSIAAFVVVISCWYATQALFWAAGQLLSSLKDMSKPKMAATSRLASANVKRYRNWTPSTLGNNHVNYVD